MEYLNNPHFITTAPRLQHTSTNLSDEMKRNGTVLQAADSGGSGTNQGNVTTTAPFTECIRCTHRPAHCSRCIRCSAACEQSGIRSCCVAALHALLLHLRSLQQHHQGGAKLRNAAGLLSRAVLGGGGDRLAARVLHSGCRRESGLTMIPGPRRISG